MILTPEEEDGLVVQRKNLSNAGSLESFPPFQWFLENCLDVAVKEAQESACDTNKTDEECRVARNVRKALMDVRSWVEKRRVTAQEYIDARANRD